MYVETLNGEIKLLYEHKVIPYVVIDKKPYEESKEEEILSMRESLPLKKQKKDTLHLQIIHGGRDGNQAM